MTDREAIRRLAVIVANLATLRNERDSVYDLIREMDDAEPAAPTVTREQAEWAEKVTREQAEWAEKVMREALRQRDPSVPGLARELEAALINMPAFFRAVADALEGE